MSKMEASTVNTVQLIITATLTATMPSILVILTWLHNNSRLNRLEIGQDNLHKRIDTVVSTFHGDMMSFQSSMHNDMMNFQASLLESVYSLKERVAVIESDQAK